MSLDFDVLTIGNAIVDILSPAEEDILVRLGVTKGMMRLIDAEEASRIYDMMGPAVEASGGSAANTAAGVASLGGHAAYIGKVAIDAFGEVFTHDMRAQGVHFETRPLFDGAPTSATETALDQAIVSARSQLDQARQASQQADAERLGLNFEKGRPVMVRTANGNTQGWHIRLDTVRVGDITVYGVDAVVSPQPMPFVLLGNSFLSQLHMTRQGNEMVLEQR